jgi:hypothetical protein
MRNIRHATSPYSTGIEKMVDRGHIELVEEELKHLEEMYFPRGIIGFW